jgi:hypothetical protein
LRRPTPKGAPNSYLTIMLLRERSRPKAGVVRAVLALSGKKPPSDMKKINIAVLSAALLCASVSVGLAQGLGAIGMSPGHEMQEHGSKPGSPGASGYAPGHQDRDDLHGLRDQASDKDRGRTRDRDDMKFGKDRHDVRGLRDQAGDKDRDGNRDRDDMRLKKDRDDRKGDIR